MSYSNSDSVRPWSTTRISPSVELHAATAAPLAALVVVGEPADMAGLVLPAQAASNAMTTPIVAAK